MKWNDQHTLFQLCDGDSTASYQQQHINNVMVIIHDIFALYTNWWPLLPNVPDDVYRQRVTATNMQFKIALFFEENID